MTFLGHSCLSHQPNEPLLPTQIGRFVLLGLVIHGWSLVTKKPRTDLKRDVLKLYVCHRIIVYIYICSRPWTPPPPSPPNPPPPVGVGWVGGGVVGWVGGGVVRWWRGWVVGPTPPPCGGGVGGGVVGWWGGVVVGWLGGWMVGVWFGVGLGLVGWFRVGSGLVGGVAGWFGLG